MHIEQVIARERQARQRRYALEDAARQALSILSSAAGDFESAWSVVVENSLRHFGAEATGRALLSLGRAARFRKTKA